MRRFFLVAAPLMLLSAIALIALAGDPVDDLSNRREKATGGKDFIWRVRREGDTPKNADGLELLIEPVDKAKKTIKGKLTRRKRIGMKNEYEKGVPIVLSGKAKSNGVGKGRPKHRFTMIGVDDEGDLLRIMGAYREGKSKTRTGDEQLVIRIEFFDPITLEKLEKTWSLGSIFVSDDNPPCNEIPDDDVMTEEDADVTFMPEP